MRNFVLLLLNVCLVVNSLLPVRRAAFDLGSGSLKLVVADVNAEMGTLSEPIVTDSIQLPVGFAVLANQGIIPDEIVVRALSALKQLKELALEHGAHEFSGFATAAFRNAANGKIVVDELSKQLAIPLALVTQRDEGLIGLAAAQLSKEEIDWDHAVISDVGSGSFQVMQHFNQGLPQVYGGNLGGSTLLNFLQTRLRIGLGRSVMPLSVSEIDALVAFVKAHLKIPEWLNGESLKECVTINSFNSRLVGSLKFTPSQLYQAIVLSAAMQESTDEIAERMHQDPEAIMRAILLYAIADHLGIEQIRYLATPGTAAGFLVDNSYWNNLSELWKFLGDEACKGNPVERFC